MISPGIKHCILLAAMVCLGASTFAEIAAPTDKQKQQWQEEMIYRDAPFTVKQGAPEDVNGVQLYQVEIPSPIKTASEANNIISGYYYQPNEPTRAAVIVLPVANTPQLAPERVIASYLAHHGFKAFVMPMPYQLSRGKDANTRNILQLAARDMDGTLVHEGGRQAVLDVKRVRQWLVRDQGVDPDRVGVVGLSLGSLVASVAYSTDSTFHAAVLVLGGGGLGDVIWNGSRETVRIKNAMIDAGKDIDWARQLTAPLDPVNYGNPARRDGVLMINAADDAVFPRKSADALNEALGRPPMVLLPGDHRSVGFYAPLIVTRINQHMTEQLLDRKPSPSTLPAAK